MISLSMLVYFIIVLMVTGCVWWLLYWLINYIAPPEPFRKIANVVLAIFAVLIIIGILMSLLGGQPVFRP